MVRYHALPSNCNPCLPSAKQPKRILPIRHARLPKAKPKSAMQNLYTSGYFRPSRPPAERQPPCRSILVSLSISRSVDSRRPVETQVVIRNRGTKAKCQIAAERAHASPNNL